jgi:hypothetical protein
MNAYRGNLVNAPSQNSFMLLARSLMQEQQKQRQNSQLLAVFSHPETQTAQDFRRERRADG